LQNCASPDTPIATPFGDRPISSLSPGDLVYSIDGFGIRAVPLIDVASKPAPDHTVLRIAFDTGASWEVSARHPTADGKLLLHLAPGDQVGDALIVSIDEIPFRHDRTYDILPASPSGVYFADGTPLGSTLFRR
jgi:hypothetical protein